MFFFQTGGIFDGYLRFNLLWFVIEVKFLPIMQGNIWFATTSSLVVFKFSSDAYIVLLDIDQLILFFCHFIEIFLRNILVIGRKALPLHSLNKNQALQLGSKLSKSDIWKVWIRQRNSTGSGGALTSSVGWKQVIRHSKIQNEFTSWVSGAFRAKTDRSVPRDAVRL